MFRRPLLFLCAAALALPFWLCGCAAGGSDPAAPVTAGFACDADIQYRDMQVKGHLSRISAGMLKMEITAPATLQGMTTEFNGETLSVKMHGIGFSVDPSTLPESALGSCILGALDTGFRTARTGGGDVTEEGVRTEGEAPSGTFEILSDPVSGALLSLKIPAADLSATFTNFQQITG